MKASATSMFSSNTAAKKDMPCTWIQKQKIKLKGSDTRYYNHAKYKDFFKLEEEEEKGELYQ